MKNEYDIFGSSDPRKMPGHFFYGARKIEYDTAIKAKIEKQNYSVCPREWYVDARFSCQDCGSEFLWMASEQKAWFEDHFFWVDSYPKRCKLCRKEKRNLKKVRKEYDRLVEQARTTSKTDVKKKVLNLISEMEDYSSLSDKIIETKEILAKQIKKAEQ